MMHAVYLTLDVLVYESANVGITFSGSDVLIVDGLNKVYSRLVRGADTCDLDTCASILKTYAS